MRITWRGFEGGFGRLPALRWQFWVMQRWSWRGRRHYGIGPIVVSFPEPEP